MWGVWTLTLACAAAPPAPISDGAAPDPVVESDPVAKPPPPSMAPSTIRGAFPPPAGFRSLPANDFARWLQDRPVLAPDAPVTTYDGRFVEHEARVIDLPLVPGDLQQCADSAIRLRAEWERSVGRSPSFHATSGDPIPWERYARGETPYETGNRLAWKRGGNGTWDGWLVKVFTWAGTRSLQFDTVAAVDPRPGDLLVAPGSPGHAVVLLDVATDGAQTRVLVGEGYMPAQSFHVEIGPHDGWWPYEDGVALPHWTLPAAGLRRWPE